MWVKVETNYLNEEKIGIWLIIVIVFWWETKFNLIDCLTILLSQLPKKGGAEARLP